MPPRCPVVRSSSVRYPCHVRSPMLPKKAAWPLIACHATCRHAACVPHCNARGCACGSPWGAFPALFIPTTCRGSRHQPPLPIIAPDNSATYPMLPLRYLFFLAFVYGGFSDAIAATGTAAAATRTPLRLPLHPPFPVTATAICLCTYINTYIHTHTCMPRLRQQ